MRTISQHRCVNLAGKGARAESPFLALAGPALARRATTDKLRRSRAAREAKLVGPSPYLIKTTNEFEIGERVGRGKMNRGAVCGSRRTSVKSRGAIMGRDCQFTTLRLRRYVIATTSNSSKTGGDMLLTQPPQTHNMPALSKCIISVVLVHT